MIAFNTMFILVIAFVAVFLEASFDGLRQWLGVQVDLLSGLMVYASLSSGLTTVTLLAVLGGLWFDSLSANPLGVSVLPLFAIGLSLQQYRHLILRDQPYAQWVLGCAASAAGPLLSVLLLGLFGYTPLVGWASLWQWLVMSAIGGALTPCYFVAFDALKGVLAYRPVTEPSFREDREIARGRS